MNLKKNLLIISPVLCATAFLGIMVIKFGYVVLGVGWMHFLFSIVLADHIRKELKRP